MTVGEMSERIRMYCESCAGCDDCPLGRIEKRTCYDHLTDNDEEIKRNYYILFGDIKSDELEKKRRSVYEYCGRTPCLECVLQGNWESDNENAGCINIRGASEAELDRALQLIAESTPEGVTDDTEPEEVHGEQVEHPTHYCYSKYEPKDVIRAWGLNFNLGSVVKYIARAGRKDDILMELQKAREFLTFEIEAIEEERKNG